MTRIAAAAMLTSSRDLLFGAHAQIGGQANSGPPRFPTDGNNQPDDNSPEWLPNTCLFVSH